MEAMNDMIDESLIIDLVIRDEVLKDKDRQLVEYCRIIAHALNRDRHGL